MKVLATKSALMVCPLALVRRAATFRFSMLMIREKRLTRSKKSARLW